MSLTATRTHTTYFDAGLVDETVGAAYKALEADYLARKSAISVEDQRRIEARLDLLRAAWVVLTDRAC